MKSNFTTVTTLLLIVILGFANVVNIASSPEQRGPVIDKLRFKVVWVPDAQLIEMLTGGTDVWTTLVSPENERDVTMSADDILRESDIEMLYDYGFTMTSAPGYHTAYFGFNIRSDQSYRNRSDGYQAGLILSDVNFRHACIHAFNQRGFGGARWTIEAVQSLVPPAQCWMDPDVPTHPYNLGDPMATTSYPTDHSSCGILRYGGYVYDPVRGNWITPYDLDGDTIPGDPDDVIPEMLVVTPSPTVAPASTELASMWITDLHSIGLNSITAACMPLGRGLVEEWRYPMFYYEWGWFGSSPAIANLGPDVNNNGTEPDSDLEIIVGSDEWANYYSELGGWAGGIWRCLDSDGSLEWAIDSRSDETRGSAAVVDIEGDGYLDIAGGTTSGETVEVMDRFGNFTWTFPQPPRTGNFYYPGAPAVADLDPTVEGLEVIIGNRPFGTVLAFDGDNSDGVDEGISAVGIPGSPYAGVEGVDWDLLWIFYTGDRVWASPAVGDVDNDGRVEVVIGSTDSNVYVLDGPTGSLEYAFSTAEAVYASAALANLDGDAFTEMVIGSTDDSIYCFQWDGVTASTEWVYPTGGDVFSSAAIGDVDRDGSLEMVVGSIDGSVYSISASGNMEWSYPTGGPVYSSPALANTDEVLMYAMDWPMFRNNPSRTGLYTTPPPTHLDVYVGSDSGHLYLLDGDDGSLIDRFPVYTGSKGGIHTSPSVADVDGDNKLEILFYDWGMNSTRNGHTFWCLEDEPFGSKYDVFQNADFDVYFVGTNVDRFPDFLYELCHSSQDCRVYPWRHNAPGLCDPELDNLVETVRYSIDHGAKVAACQEIQEKLCNESYDYAFAYVPAYSKMCFGAHQPGLLGIVNTEGHGSDNMWTYLNIQWEPGHPNERIEAGNTVVVWCLQDKPERLNPTYAGSTYAWTIMNPIFDPLIAVNPYTHEDLPWLAESWSLEEFTGAVTLDSENRFLGVPAGGPVDIDNGMKITFNLRDDVEWQDGNIYVPLDAEFNLEFLRNNQIPRYASMWEHIVDVQVYNSTAFTVYSDVTSQWLLYDLACTGALLPPPVWLPLDGKPLRTILSYDPGANITMPIGAGPRFGTADCPNQLYGTGPFVFQFYAPVGMFAEMLANRYYFKTTAEIHDQLVEMFHRCGDVDRDGEVWGIDMARLFMSYGYEAGEPEYDADADLNGDGIIDAEEVDIFGLHVGYKRTYPDPGGGTSSSSYFMEEESFSSKSLEVQESSSTDTTIFVDPASVSNETLQAGTFFTANLSISDASNLRTGQVKMSWNATLLNVTQITEGDFLKGNPAGSWKGKPSDHITDPYFTETKSASTSTPGVIAGWIFPFRAFADDNYYATCNTPDAEEIYGGYGFSTGSITAVTKLEVGIQAYMQPESNITELDKLEVQVSNDGGATWGPNHEVPVYIYEHLWWVDVTNDFLWTPTMLTDINFKVKVRYKQAGVIATTIYLNWIPGRVLDTLNVDNPVAAYDTNLNSYASFRYSETDANFTVWDFGHNFPGGGMWPADETSEIVQVDLYVRYLANASALGDKYRIVYYVPIWTTDPIVLVDWTSSEAPLDTYVWTNIPDPDTVFPEWDWLDISNLEIAVETDSIGGDPDAFFREYEAWIVVTYERPTAFGYRINQGAGWCLFAHITRGRHPGVTGNGTLATLEFHVLEYGHSILNITHPQTKLLRLRCHPLIPQKLPHLTEDGYFNNRIPGDIQGDTPGTPPDGDVDRYDFFAFSAAYLAHPGDPNWEPLADIQGDTPGTPPDGDVDRYDFFAFSANYLRTIY